MQQIYHEEQGL